MARRAYDVSLRAMRNGDRAAASAEAVRALLVDRDRDTREMYAEYLRTATYAVAEAGDGRQALAIALERRPSIVVTETRLPGIDGFELCRLLRADAATTSTPILVVTADAYAADLQRARDAGASEVLVKPCLPEVVLVEIQRLLRASAMLRDRSTSIREKAGHELARSARLLERGAAGRRTLVRSHDRRRTVTPPASPLALVCPQCDTALTYDYSHIGGVSANNSEQWDYFTCGRGCGAFQFRQRTRRLRRVS
jgi:DNA-binding response OmpR family regulator